MSIEAWNRVNAVVGTIGTVVAWVLLAALLVVLSPLLLWWWAKRRLDWG